MSGIPEFNFPAFHAAERDLLRRGYAVLNPARNFDGETGQAREAYMLVDLKNVLRADVVFVLDGWEKSRGALVEVLVGRETGKTISSLGDEGDDEGEPWAVRGVHVSLTETGKEIPSLDKEGEPRGVSEETILDEAERIVGGARNKQYGHPLDDFTKTGRIWAVVLGLEEVTPEQVALCMALGVKGSRLIKDPQHHDSMVDCAGYIRCLDRINRRREGLE